MLQTITLGVQSEAKLVVLDFRLFCGIFLQKQSTCIWLEKAVVTLALIIIFLLVNKIGCRGHKENSSVVEPSHAASVLLCRASAPPKKSKLATV